MASSDQEVRRKALNHVIKQEHSGNRSAFARRADKPAAQIADMLAGRKKFGEKIARQIERRAGLAKGLLDIDPDSPQGVHAVREAMTAYGLPITPDEAAHGRAWGKLRAPIRELLQQLVDVLVSEQDHPKPPARKPRRNGDRPRAA